MAQKSYIFDTFQNFPKDVISAPITQFKKLKNMGAEMTPTIRLL